MPRDRLLLWFPNSRILYRALGQAVADIRIAYENVGKGGGRIASVVYEETIAPTLPYNHRVYISVNLYLSRVCDNVCQW